LFSHRFYNAMVEAPFSEDLDYSSDYLDEFHGRDAYYDSDEDGNIMMDDPLSYSPINTRLPLREEDYKTNEGLTSGLDNEGMFDSSNIQNTISVEEEVKSQKGK